MRLLAAPSLMIEHAVLTHTMLEHRIRSHLSHTSHLSMSHSLRKRTHWSVMPRLRAADSLALHRAKGGAQRPQCLSPEEQDSSRDGVGAG